MKRWVILLCSLATFSYASAGGRVRYEKIGDRAAEIIIVQAPDTVRNDTLFLTPVWVDTVWYVREAKDTTWRSINEIYQEVTK